MQETIKAELSECALFKLSYSCTPNVENLIKQHNSSIMKSGTNRNQLNVILL